MKAFQRRLISLLICLVLSAVIMPSALAEEVENDCGILDGDELQTITDSIIEKHGLDPAHVSVAYCYTPTGDTWYYNENEWYYSASMYKVPLMMIFAEKEYNGELTQESNIKGLTLAQAEEYVLTYSSNDYAHLMMNYLGTDRECREMYQQYSDLPVSEYDPDFYDYSYFTARFMMDVMKELYFESEHFPGIIPCLKNAQTDDYFNLYLNGEYEVAQKYGAFKEFNHTTGIIYTPNPFILTVMTEFGKPTGYVSGDFALAMKDYTLKLDEQLAAYEAEQEAERLKAEEEARLAEEEAKKAAEEAEKKAEEAAAEPTQLPLVKEESQKEEKSGSGLVKIGIVLLVIVLALAVILVLVMRAKAASASHYKPRH